MTELRYSVEIVLKGSSAEYTTQFADLFGGRRSIVHDASRETFSISCVWIGMDKFNDPWLQSYSWGE